MVKCVLAGFQHKDYVSKTSNARVIGCNLFLIGPRAQDSQDYQAMHGSEVFTEFVRPDVFQGVQLAVGGLFDVEYGRGFNGKASVIALSPLIDMPSPVVPASSAASLPRDK